MARPDMTELIESAAPAPRAALDVEDIARRAHSHRRRRRATIAAASVAVAVALASQLLTDRHEREVVVAERGPSRPIPIEIGAGTVTARLALLDGTEIALTLPDAVGSGVRVATVADVELHGSVYSESGRGWRVDVSVGSVEEMLPGAEDLAVPPLMAATAAVVDRQRGRLGLQFGSWALVASGDSLSDADIDAIVDGVVLAETAEGFVKYRGSLRLGLVDSPDLIVRGQGLAVSVFLRQCPTSAPTSPTAAGLDLARLDDPNRATRLTLLCDRARRIEVGIDAAEHLRDGDVDQIDIEVVRTGPTLSAVQGATRNVASPGNAPPGGGVLECGSSQPEYVDGIGDGGGRDLPSDPSAEKALQRYVENEPTLPDSGYNRLSQGDGAQGREEFVFAEDGRRTAQVHVQRSPDGGWRAVGHARCR